VNYREALAWLYATQRFGIKLGLDNIRRLLDELELGSVVTRSSSRRRIVHVAGTNGKGSVCAMAASICRAAGYRTGLFTSPHLVTFRERIQIDGELITEAAAAEGLSRIRDLTSAWDPSPTFFEITTALAVRHFVNEQVEILILETGMGGRLDATNAVTPDISVITPIAMDHQSWLGDTISQIAREKAGITKPSVPVVSAPQLPDAERVLVARAAECSSHIEFVTAEYDRRPIALAGNHQRRNAALAVAALRAVHIAITDQTIATGLATVEWPARFQAWSDRIIIDGAHNPAGAEILAATWRERFGDEKAALVFGVFRDKHAAEIYGPLASIAASVFLPDFRGERVMPPDDLAQIITASAAHHPIITVDCASAIQQAIATDRPVLITGSLHLAGEALAHLSGRPAAFEECAQ
jgi:dihydrofolate synthase/folylpolyglutamate synthase